MCLSSSAFLMLFNAVLGSYTHQALNTQLDYVSYFFFFFSKTDCQLFILLIQFLFFELDVFETQNLNSFTHHDIVDLV